MKTFPIMAEYDSDNRKRYPARTIPWDLIKPHEAQAADNHYQDLPTLASRGGLSRCEACAVLEDRKWTAMSLPDADAFLSKHYND